MKKDKKLVQEAKERFPKKKSKENLQNQNIKDSKVKERPLKEIAKEMQMQRIAALNDLNNHDKSN